MGNESGTWIMYGVDWDDPECLHSVDEAIDYINEVGFLPLFKNDIPGFSLEERTVPEYWWSGDVEVDPWAWRELIARSGKVAYGKFFDKKAGFISTEWLPYFVNYRRDGYDFDARWDDGLAFRGDKDLYELLAAHAPILSKALKNIEDYRKGGRTGFDTVMSRLQAQGYVLISDFIYERNRKGEAYGWGIAQYSTPESFFGPAFRRTVYERTPAESFERMFTHLQKLLPQADEALLRRILK